MVHEGLTLDVELRMRAVADDGRKMSVANV